MNKKNVIYIVEMGNSCVSAFGYRDGMPLGTFVKDIDVLGKLGTERVIKERFSAQFMAWKYKGHKQVDKHTRVNWDIIYMSIDDVANKKVIDLPKIDKVAKPKIYEIKEQGNGFMVVKHEWELMNEDEVKLKLFAKCANE